MSITTYVELQSAMSAWLGHTLYATQYPDFITLFEAYAARKLKIRPMETTSLIAMTSGVGPLPTGYLGFIRVTWAGSVRRELTYLHPSYLEALYPVGTDIPLHFTIEGSSIKTRSTDSTQLEMLHHAKNTALASALNNLFTNHPDAYLFGSLCEAEAFGVNDERVSLWKSRRDEVMNEISLLDFHEPGQMQIRVDGATP